ncbi:MAG: POT family MFS transporter [Planctomycetota bacterium]|nr:POT family MFS transporter [Planctomycetota bacterium]
MSKPKFLTAPVASEKMPGGIPFIIGNEAAERFSFYGMKAILVAFMTKFLVDAAGNPAPMSDDNAKAYYPQFVAAAYFFPLLGGPIADMFLGKYRTIIWLSIVYCLGHLALALDDTRLGLLAGLSLIALGTGAIKPCVSAHVGDQFGKSNAHKLEKVFGWFYVAINVGAFVSSLLTPWLLKEFPTWLKTNYPQFAPADPAALSRLGPHVAFGVPGVLMLLATLIFWLGRNRYVHVPPRGVPAVMSSLKGEGGKALLRLIPLYCFIAVFWALYDQTGAAWVLQAEKMDRKWLGILWDESQVQEINPALILAYVPLFSFVIFPTIQKFVNFKSMARVAVGLFLMVAAFGITAIAQDKLDAAHTVSIEWQLVAYLIITAAEVLVSVTCLEFSYTQAPVEVKSFIMAMYLASVGVGNEMTAIINKFIQNADGTSKLPGASYFWFFTWSMLVTAFLFLPIAYFYREKAYIQEEQPSA